MPDQPVTRPVFGSRYFYLALLLLLAAVTYAPSFNNDFIYDDIELVVNRPAAQGIGDVVNVFAEPHWHNLAYYRPLSGVTMLLQKTWHGNVPFAFHLFNWALVCVAGMLFFALLRLPVFGVGRMPAFLAAALFVVHPITSSCVYPICSGRETLLPGVFILGGLLCWLNGRWIWAMVCAVLGLLCKEQAIVVVVIFVAADALGLTPYAKVGFRRYLPWIAVLPIYFFIRHRVFAGDVHDPVMLALFEKPLGPVHTVLFYIQTVFTPFIELRYEPRIETWLNPMRLGLAVTLLVAVILRYMRPFPVRDPRFWFLVLFAGSVAAPTANILHQEAEFSERYVWLAMSFVPGAIVVFSERFAKWDVLAWAMVLVVLAGISFSRDRAFADYEAFLTRWIESDPGVSQPELSMGDLRVSEGRVAESIPHFQRALEINPESAIILNNFGAAYNAMAQYTNAVEILCRAVALHENNWTAHDNLGISYFRLKRRDQAEHHFKRAIEIQPKAASAAYNLGVIAEQKGDRETARIWYDRAIEADSTYHPPYVSLGMYYFSLKDAVRSVECFKQALAVNPYAARAHYGLSVIYALQGRNPEALRHGQEAQRMTPDDPDVRQHMQRLMQHLQR